MGALGQIGMGREQAMRQTGLEELAAPSNAFLEARQMQEFEQGNQAFTEQMRQNAIGIISDPNTPQEIKNFYQNQLAEQYGVGPGAPGTVGPGGGATSPGVTNAATIPTIQRVEAFATTFTELGLDNVKIKESQFKDSIVSNANDLGQLVTELGSANAANNPNYNYQYEINLVNRAITDVTSLTNDEVTKLNKYTSSFGNFGPPLALETGMSSIPKSEATDAFINHLIEQGLLSATNFKVVDQKTNFWNKTVEQAIYPSGSYNTLKQYAQLYQIPSGAVDQDILAEQYNTFLNTYNTKYKTGA
jgi:hypothetical protein